MSKSNLVDALILEIQRISDKLNVKPSELKKAQFLSESKEYKEWDLRKVGGYASLLKTYFPFEEKDFASIVDQKKKQAYVSKLEEKLGESELRMREFPKALSDTMARNSIIQPLVLSSKETKAYFKQFESAKSADSHRSVCTLWSDQHFGTNFTKDHTKGLSEYNWVIAARRLALLCEQLAKFRKEKRGLHEELVIFMIGDNIAGVIHDQEGGHIDLSAEQVWGTAGYYIQAIRYLLNFYPKIRIEFQTGNHGRVMHKKSKDRAMIAKYDSFETIIATHLVGHFSNEPRVTINIPKAPYSDVTVQGHRVYATHGDTVFNVGNPGKSIPLAKIEQQINSINANLPPGESRYDLFVTGHVHHYMSTHVGNVAVLVNGCMVGTDPFALSIGIHDNNPTQSLWETTKEHVYGDLRQIHVKLADNKSPETLVRFDKIITPYSTNFPNFYAWWNKK